MVNFYEVYDVFLEEKILIMALRGLTYIPIKHEEVSLNGNSFYVMHVKNNIEVSSNGVEQTLDVYVGKKQLYENYSFGQVIVDED